MIIVTTRKLAQVEIDRLQQLNTPAKALQIVSETEFRVIEQTDIWPIPLSTADQVIVDASNAQQAQDVTDTTAIKGIALLNTLANSTPTQIDTYYTNNVTTLAQLIAVSKLQTKALAVIYRKEIRS